jgi:serine phosphatase RsbU (regulator of sigma subunit)
MSLRRQSIRSCRKLPRTSAKPLCLSLALLLSMACPIVGTAQPTVGPETAPTLAILDIKDIGRGTVPIDGEWQFHLGDDRRWASPSYDDSRWEHLKADISWGAQTHPSYSGFAWYRRHLDITPSGAAHLKFAILMPAVEDEYDLYWNGVKIGDQGMPPPHAVWYTAHRQSFAFPVSPTGATEGVLAVRVWKAKLASFDYSTLGGMKGLPLLGDVDSITRRIGSDDYESMRRNLYFRMVIIIIALMGLVSLFTWARDRKLWVFLWFGVWSMGRVAQFLTTMPSINFSLSHAEINCILQFIFSIHNCAALLLLFYLFDLQDNTPLRRWTWLVVGVQLSAACADGLMMLFWADAGPGMQWADAFMSFVIMLCRMFGFVLAYRGLRRRINPEFKLVAIIAFLDNLMEIVRLSSRQGVRFTHWTLTTRLSAPLFDVAAAGITVLQILDTVLLATVAYALLRHLGRESRRQVGIELELKSARELQQVLIPSPEALPEIFGYAIASVYCPAQEVGGDFFQIIPMQGGATLVILGDVSGKGLKAAMNVALIVGTVRTLTEFQSDPASILAGLNRRLVGRMQGGFTTALAFRFDRLGHCTLANAGQLPPFLNSNEMTLAPSLPLGIDLEAEYRDQDFTLDCGDRLMLHTDGVLEARSEKGELYGFGRLTALLAGRPDAESIVDAALAFGQEDDITVLTIERLPVEEGAHSVTVNFSEDLVPA